MSKVAFVQKPAPSLFRSVSVHKLPGVNAPLPNRTERGTNVTKQMQSNAVSIVPLYRCAFCTRNKIHF